MARNILRGPLKKAISTASPDLIAGREFSVIVRLENPFEVPVTVLSVGARLPTEFHNLGNLSRAAKLQKLRDVQNRYLGVQKEDGAPKSPELSFRGSLRWLFSWNVRKKMPESIWAIALSSEAHRKIENVQLPIFASSPTPALEAAAKIINTPSGQGPSGTEAPSEGDDEKEKFLNELAKRIHILEDPDPIGRILEPGASAVFLFTVRTRRNVRFRPSVYKLNVEVEYKVDGKTKTEAVQRRIRVRGSLASLIFGAAAGGIVGCLARKLTGSSNTHIHAADLAHAAGCVFVSVMVVVLLERRTDAQPIVSVGDFWGGFAVGVLIGYCGTSQLDRILPAQLPSAD